MICVKLASAAHLQMMGRSIDDSTMVLVECGVRICSGFCCK